MKTHKFAHAALLAALACSAACTLGATEVGDGNPSNDDGTVDPSNPNPGNPGNPGGPSSPTPGEPVAGEPANLQGITAAHNATRAEVGQAPLQWSNELAALGAQFIADCQFSHSGGGERSNVAGFSYVGENLYQSSGMQITGAAVNAAWASEKPNYNPSTGTCQGGVCGHYTQQVWSTTTHVGCAAKACGGSTIVVCEYGPGGNYQGQPAY